MQFFIRNGKQCLKFRVTKVPKKRKLKLIRGEMANVRREKQTDHFAAAHFTSHFSPYAFTRPDRPNVPDSIMLPVHRWFCQCFPS